MTERCSPTARQNTAVSPLCQLLWAAWSRRPQQTALHALGKEFSFAELQRRAASLGSWLRREKISCLAYCARNDPSFLELACAALFAGTLFSPLNPRLAAKELLDCLEKSGADCLIVDQLQWEKLAAQEVGEKLPQLKIVNLDRKTPSPFLHLSLKNSSHFCPQGSLDDLAFLLFTAGTTGNPKGCLRTQRRFHALLKSSIDAFGITANDRFLVASSLSHSAPGRFSLSHLLAGAAVVLLKHFDPEEVLHTIAEKKITTLFLVPTQLFALLQQPKKKSFRKALPSLRALLCAGAPFPEELKKEALDEFGDQVLYEFYGATELGTVSVLPPHLQRSKAKSVGKPLPICSVQIRREDGTLAPPGEAGEIAVSTPASLSGTLSGQSVNESTHYSAGDIGYLDPDGFLYLLGRKSNKIISGGLNVQAEEVERVLRSHPALEEVAVLGLPDPYWGEKITACLVAKNRKPLAESELKEFCKPFLGAYKVPKQWFFFSELPKNAAGKIWRDKLCQELLLKRSRSTS